MKDKFIEESKQALSGKEIYTLYDFIWLSVCVVLVEKFVLHLF